MTLTETTAPPGTAIVVSHEATIDSYRRGLEPADIDGAYRIGKAIFAAGLYGLKSAEDGLARIMTGRELGLTAMQSLRGLYSVEGKIGLDASLMHALALQSPLCDQFECTGETNDSVTYTLRRKGWREPQVVTWTLAMAEQAGLLNRGGSEGAKRNNNWNKYPKAMLHARCKADGARRVFPEVLFGIQTIEELRDMADNRDSREAVTDADDEANAARQLADDLIESVRSARTKEERRQVRARIDEVTRSGELVGQELKRVIGVFNDIVQAAKRAESRPEPAGDAAPPAASGEAQA